MDVETCFNNRRLTYVEDDVELSVLTPNPMITEELCVLPDEESKSSEKEMKRRAKHVLRCKKAIWTRWTGEYMRALTERHNLRHEDKQSVQMSGKLC